MQNLSLESNRVCDGVPNDLEAELETCNFYTKVIKEMYKLYLPTFEDIRNSLKNIRSYKNPELEVHEIVSFDEEIDRFAYNFSYCFIHSVVMYEHIFHMLKSNPSMLEKIVSMTKLQLCLLGGGAGYEAVSICKILNNLRRQRNMKCHPLLLNITIIDVCEGWEKDAKLISSLAQSEICSSSDIKIDFNFIVADLTADFSEEVRKALKKSHIVTLCKFVTDVNNSSYRKSEIPEMIEKIIECMPFKACLFFLDNAGGGVFKKLYQMIDRHSQTYRIYETGLYNCHMLSIDSVDMVSRSLRNIFRHLKCTIQTTISCSAWLKIRHTINVNKLSSGISAITASNAANDLEPQKLKSKARKVKVKKMYQSTPILKEELCIANDIISHACDSLLDTELQSNAIEEQES